MTPSKSAVPFWFIVAPMVSTNRRDAGREMELLLGHPQGGRQGRVARRGGEGGDHRLLDALEEGERAHAAQEPHGERVDDELVDRQGQQHDAHVDRELLEDLVAELGREVEQQGHDADRGEGDHQVDQPHADVEQPLDRVLEAQGGRGADEGEPEADDQGEEHDRQHVARRPPP